jgi:hypothetical protein
VAPGTGHLIIDGIGVLKQSFIPTMLGQSTGGDATEYLPAQGNRLLWHRRLFWGNR